MNKERLEEIKQAYGYGRDLPEDTYPFWLIERVQELKIRCAEIAGESTAIEERSFKRIKAIESQVKRYREALKQIEENTDGSIRNTACKALEESE